MIPNKIKNLLKLDVIKNKNFSIPKFIFFKVEQWENNYLDIVKNIQINFDKKVAVRSAALTEDNNSYSNAGKYLSILNINVNDKKNIINAVNKVINSYEKKKYKSNYIIIQSFITNISISGVIFSQDLISGGPYFVINYDDQTGKTDTITSGQSSHSNKVLYIRKNHTISIKSERFKKTIIAVKKISSTLKLKFLDIEFCIDKNMNIFIFQARRLNLNNKISSKIINRSIDNNKIKIKKFFNKYYIENKNTILGKMPDWNPVEIIGSNPKTLAYDLYAKLITNRNWYKAREIMGYSKFYNTKLMYNFCGSPFVDTYKSFKSLIPNSLSKKIKEKLIKYYIDKLKNNHDLHDKIEFEIALSSFDFSLNNKLNAIPNFTTKEKNTILKSLRDLFLKNFYKDSEGSIEKNIIKIKKLDLFQKNFNNKKEIKANDIKKIINNCSEFGIIPFAILARHAFISTNILNSLVERKYLSKKKSLIFKESISTVLTKYLEDLNKLSSNKITRKLFMENYGHLRPGTYDVESKRYDQFNYIDTKQKRVLVETKKFKLNKNEYIKIESLIKKNKLDNIGTYEFFKYLKESIEAREYAKFVFTKSISYLLEVIPKNIKFLKKRDISFLKINEINEILKENKTNKKIIFNKISNRQKDYKTNLNIKTPQLIIDSSYIDVVPFQTNKANFITDKKVSGGVLVIDKLINIKKTVFRNKIVLIENADPGYDWLFTKNILALVTKYGGRNSHMAIRCYELKIPAVIGCGEKMYHDLVSSNKIYIDSNNEIIKKIN